MMIYRSVERETTDNTPNSLVLGREVITPLDLMYKIPPIESNIPQHRWVWEQKHTWKKLTVQ